MQLNLKCRSHLRGDCVLFFVVVFSHCLHVMSKIGQDDCVVEAGVHDSALTVDVKVIPY